MKTELIDLAERFNWQDVADAANRVYLKLYPGGKEQDPLEDSFDGRLPLMCEMLLLRMVKTGSVLEGKDVNLLIQGLVALDKYGAIEHPKGENARTLEL